MAETLCGSSPMPDAEPKPMLLKRGETTRLGVIVGATSYRTSAELET
jgi:hypothetical protein